jgi:hypothetical protein
MKSLKVKIYKPFSVNNISDKYKIVAWRDGIQDLVKFQDTLKQAKIEKEKYYDIFKYKI